MSLSFLRAIEKFFLCFWLKNKMRAVNESFRKDWIHLSCCGIFWWYDLRVRNDCWTSRFSIESTIINLCKCFLLEKESRPKAWQIFLNWNESYSFFRIRCNRCAALSFLSKWFQREVDFLIIEYLPNDEFSFIMYRIKVDELKDS
jgi:hypothetical protein